MVAIIIFHHLEWHRQMWTTHTFIWCIQIYIYNLSKWIRFKAMEMRIARCEAYETALPQWFSFIACLVVVVLIFERSGPFGSTNNKHACIPISISFHFLGSSRMTHSQWYSYRAVEPVFACVRVCVVWPQFQFNMAEHKMTSNNNYMITDDVKPFHAVRLFQTTWKIYSLLLIWIILCTIVVLAVQGRFAAVWCNCSVETELASLNCSHLNLT